MLVSGIATVEHGLVEGVVIGVVRPGVRIAQVAPSVVTQLLFHGPGAVGDGCPRAEVVLQNVVQRLRIVLFLHHGEHAVWACEERPRPGDACLRHIFAHPYIVLGPHRVAHMLLHEDALLVIAVGVAKTVAAQLDLVQLVETGVGDVLYPGGEQIGQALRRGNRVDLRGIENWLREDGRHLGDAVHCRHGLLRGYAAQGVVSHGATEVLPHGAFQGDAHQAVHAVVCEGLFQVDYTIFQVGPVNDSSRISI